MDYDIHSDGDVAPASRDFDDRGVPLSLELARLMTEDELTQAVTDVIADLEATSFQDVTSWDKAEDGSVAIDSHLAVVVFTEFTAHLSADHLDLANVPQERWASIRGVVQVIKEAFSGLNEEAST